MEHYCEMTSAELVLKREELQELLDSLISEYQEESTIPALGNLTNDLHNHWDLLLDHIVTVSDDIDELDQYLGDFE